MFDVIDIAFRVVIAYLLIVLVYEFVMAVRADWREAHAAPLTDTDVRQQVAPLSSAVDPVSRVREGQTS